MELTETNRLSPSEYLAGSLRLLGVVLELLQTKAPIDLLCCSGIVYLVIFNCSTHEKEEKTTTTSFQWLKISDANHYRISEVDSTFQFFNFHNSCL